MTAAVEQHQSEIGRISLRLLLKVVCVGFIRNTLVLVFICIKIAWISEASSLNKEIFKGFWYFGVSQLFCLLNVPHAL